MVFNELTIYFGDMKQIESTTMLTCHNNYRAIYRYRESTDIDLIKLCLRIGYANPISKR